LRRTYTELCQDFSKKNPDYGFELSPDEILKADLQNAIIKMIKKE